MTRLVLLLLLCIRLMPSDEVYKLTVSGNSAHVSLPYISYLSGAPHYFNRPFTYVYRHVCYKPDGTALPYTEKSYVYVGSAYISLIGRLFKNVSPQCTITHSFIANLPYALPKYTSIDSISRSKLIVISEIVRDFKGRPLYDLLWWLGLNDAYVRSKKNQMHDD